MREKGYILFTLIDQGFKGTNSTQFRELKRRGPVSLSNGMALRNC